jgi:aminomethyltransferase
VAAELKYFGVCETDWHGAPIVLTRMGYTGELGFEIYCPNDLAAPLWQALAACKPAKPAGLGARDTLRLEVGYPLSGEDFDAKRTPLEAGMAPFIAWDTAFPGKARLEAQRDAGDYARLTPLKAEGRRAPRHGFPLYQGDEEVGVVTSGTFGASLGCGVGLGYVAASVAKAGVALEAGERRIAVETVDAPLYTQGTCRS